jgi:hypothetical protein
MSSLVLYERNGVVAEWNKQSAYTVRKPGQPVRHYPTEQKAIAAARRAAGRVAENYKSAPTIHDTIALARAFADEVKESFSHAEFNRMLDMNKSSHADEGICATHDFCDANMLMLNAFKKTFLREPAILTDADDEVDARLWGDAWAIAKAADFFA